MKTHLQTIALLFALCAVGCETNTVVEPPLDPVTEEPTGGQWSPIVLPSGSAIRLPDPFPVGSAQLASEMNAVRMMQSSRTVQIIDTVNYWNSGACIRWNEIARCLVIKNGTPPPRASRVYALLSVAQYDALIATWHNKYRFNRPSPEKIDKRIIPLVTRLNAPAFPSEHASVAAASAAVLAYLYPSESDSLQMKKNAHEESRLWAGVNWASDIAAGDTLGRQVAQQVIAYARTDRSDAVWTGTVPTGPGIWFSSARPPQAPLLPLWGSVKPWLMMSGSQFRPTAPPAFGSADFNAALAEVKSYSVNRTGEQLRIAQFWADGAGTYTPPGHWNDIACNLIAGRRLNDLRTARALALMNMAIMDAGISCWDAKYTYWLLRPSQADSTITLPIGFAELSRIHIGPLHVFGSGVERS
ncbi:MAG: phosphatase PAP2 family protein [Bacteroidota bacterium]